MNDCQIHSEIVLTAFTKVAPASPISALVFFMGVCGTEKIDMYSDTHEGDNKSREKPRSKLKHQKPQTN